MTKALYIILFFILADFASFAQSSVNDYKYIVVPTQYEFLKSKDQYQLNSITKFLFNKYGYIAVMQDEEYPNDLYHNKCLGLTADVVKESAFLNTKLRIDLKDCNGTVVMSSKIGQTREKEYAKAYNLALRDAFETFQFLGYAYQPNASILAKATPQTIDKGVVEDQGEIAKLKEEIKTLKEDKVVNPDMALPILETAVVAEVVKDTTPVKTNTAMNDIADLKSQTLYAQSIENGYQLVDSTPKVVMILLPTGAKDVFTVKDNNAIVFKKDKQWIYSVNDGKEVKETVLNVKF